MRHGIGETSSEVAIRDNIHLYGTLLIPAPAAWSRTRRTFGMVSILGESDRCDRCGVRAYVLVMLESGAELTFCGHHGRRYQRHADFRTHLYLLPIW